MPYALVHYHEVALKGGNRRFFERRLVQHLQHSLRQTGVSQVESLPGRIRVSINEEASWSTIQERIRHAFGVVNFSLAHRIPLDYAAPNLIPLCQAIGDEIDGRSFETFRITTKRADKRFVKTSLEVDREIGAHICEITKKRVNLAKPDLNIFIELFDQAAYYSFGRHPGPGGLPTGISGKVACLISGGIDSPVAAYRMMKRGCRVVFVHFHGRPYLSRASEEKVRDLVKRLTDFQLHSRLLLVPFGEIQSQIKLNSPPPLLVVLYRRMMMRIAEHIAEREQCWGLVTGDSLGQVASQTPGNLAVVSAVPELPILRPLIGMDKIEITNEAQQIGTFETSIEPDQDCCTLFVPPHPNTCCRLEQIQEVEEKLNVTGMVKQGLAEMDTAEFSFPMSAS
ncbi:MAG: tRNA uracil 4-sulfurtransferase ThiI [Nitrospirota bacterium]|nr:tRNA uracil 4-sulfurtransferase ThiI [Nitrospirota bacterium]